MLITNQRIIKYNEATGGVLCIDNTPLGWIIEDIERDVKIPKKTGIKADIYELGICKLDTTLTLKHRKSPLYNTWFEYHIEVLNVKGFYGVFFHIGNDKEDTEACQIGGYKLGFYENNIFGFESSKMMKEFYSIVYPVLESGEKVKYIITNEY